VADLTGSVRVLVVDDDPLVRAAIAMILGRAPGVEMVGEAADGLRCSQRSTGTSRTLC
jgi:chemotaxis response regulator CheB